MEAEITSAGPWEDFKQAGADSPPWADFKPSTSSPEEERRAAKGRALRGEQMAERRSGYGADALMAGADALGYVGDALSKADPLTIVPRLAWSLNQMGKPPEQQQAFPLDDHTPVVPIPRITSEQAADWLRTSGVSPERMAGIANAGIDFAEFFTTPTGINTLISGKLGPEVAKRALAMGFTAQMANDAPEAATRAGELLGNGNVAEGTRAALGAAANVVLPASIIGAHAKFPRVPTPGETAGKMLADTVDNPAVARQLEEIAQQQALEATLPRTTDSRLSTLDRPAGMVTTEGRPWDDFKPVSNDGPKVKSDVESRNRRIVEITDARNRLVLGGASLLDPRVRQLEAQAQAVIDEGIRSMSEPGELSKFELPPEQLKAGAETLNSPAKAVESPTDALTTARENFPSWTYVEWNHPDGRLFHGWVAGIGIADASPGVSKGGFPVARVLVHENGGEGQVPVEQLRRSSVRGEAAMETRPAAGWTPDGPREPAVSPDLAETIQALREGYVPKVESPELKVPSPKGEASSPGMPDSSNRIEVDEALVASLVSTFSNPNKHTALRQGGTPTEDGYTFRGTVNYGGRELVAFIRKGVNRGPSYTFNRPETVELYDKAAVTEQSRPPVRTKAVAILDTDKLTNPRISESVGSTSPPAKAMEQGFKNIAARQEEAHRRFVSDAVEQFGVTPEQARAALNFYKQRKWAKLDSVNGRFDLKAGNLWEAEAIREAARQGEPKPAAQPGVAPTGAEPPAQPGGEQPTLAQSAADAKPKKVRVGKSLASRLTDETQRVGDDIISFIHESGGMLSKAAAKAQGKDRWSLIAPEYDDARPLALPWHNLIYRGMRTPDKVAQAAFEAGKLSEPSVPELWQAISDASRRRRSSASTASREERFIQEEAAAHERWAKATATGKFTVTNEQLGVGDVLDVDGVKVEVTARDPETGRLTLQDGREFETQFLEDGQSIHVESWVEKTPQGEKVVDDWDQPEAAPEPAEPKVKGEKPKSHDKLKENIRLDEGLEPSGAANPPAVSTGDGGTGGLPASVRIKAAHEAYLAHRQELWLRELETYRKDRPDFKASEMWQVKLPTDFALKNAIAYISQAWPEVRAAFKTKKGFEEAVRAAVASGEIAVSRKGKFSVPYGGGFAQPPSASGFHSTRPVSFDFISREGVDKWASEWKPTSKSATASKSDFSLAPAETVEQQKVRLEPSQAAAPVNQPPALQPRKLTKAEAAEYSELEDKRRAAQEGGAPLTLEEAKRYQELTALAGQQELLAESGAASTAGRVATLQAKLAEVERLEGMARKRLYESKSGSNAREMTMQEVRGYSDAAAQLRAEIDQIQNGPKVVQAEPDLFGGNPDINSGALGQFGMGGAKPSEYALGQHTATGIKNATVDAERVRRGLPPAMEAGHRAWEGVWDEAMAKVDADPEVQDRLIASLKANPRAVTDLEDALLLHRQVDLQNEYAKATRELAQAYEDSKTFPNRAEAVAELKVRTAELSDRLLELYDVNKAVGTETGRGLAARKMMAYEDFSLAKMEMEKRAANGGAPLTDAERAEMVKLQQRIEQTQAAYDDYRAKVDQERANRMTDEAIADMKRELASRPYYAPPIIEAAREIVSKLKRQAEKSDRAIEEMLSRMSSGPDPALIYHLGVKGAAWLAEMSLNKAEFGLKLVERFGEKVRPFLDAAWERANLHLENEGAKYGDKAEPVKRLLRKRDAAGQREGIIEGLQKAKAEGVPLNLAGDYIRKLALSFVRGGITEREALVDAVHKVVTEDVGMDLTRRETMDAISGYGSFKPLDREAAKVLLRDLKGQMQQVAKLEDITAKKPLQKSGVERREQSDEERRLIQQVNEAKRRFGVVVTDPARQLKSALDAVKTRLKNQIADLEYQISTKERIVKSKTDAPFDAETKLMEVRRDELRRQLDELVPRPGRTDEQLLAASVRAVERTIADYEQRIAAGDVAVKKAKPTITSAELEALKARRDAVRAEWQELRALDGEFQRQQAEKVLERQRVALEESIAAKEKQLASGPVPPTGREVNRPADPALEGLLQKRDALNRQLAEARKKPAEQRAAEALARQLAAMQKAIAEREAKLKSGDYSTKPTTKASRPLSSPELEVARQQLDALNRQLAEARRGPKRSPEEIALAALKTRLTKLAADYADRVASKDYAPRVRKPVILDAEASRLKAIAERAKGEWRKAVALDRMANRSTAEKVMDAAVKWHRAAILSSPAVLTKLTAAAAYRTLLGPVEEATKLAWAKVLPGLANAAPRQSGLLLRAEVKALTEGMTAGMRDAWQMLKTGETDLDVLYGKGKDPAGIGEKFVLPPTWLDFFGHLHGALKSPVKRAEWARSMEKRMAWNAAQGVDVTDPGVQMRLGVEAYKDAQRAIFLQDNRVVDVYKAALRRMEDKDKATGETPLRWKAAATTSRLALPIVKVPSNIVAEALETATGLLTGSAKAARAYRKGVESLKPEEADAIMRQLGKGSLGGALLLLGFYTSGNWGGFYVHGEKRDTKDIKAGAARVDGMDVPKHLLHYPLMDVIQFGATVARVSGAKAHKRDAEPQGLPAGAVAGLMGLGDEVPFIREGVGLDKLRDPLQRDRYLAEKLKSLVIPQAVQWTARELDKNAAGETVRRDPKTTLQVLQTGLPYYRNSVPEKVEKRTR